jgi:hypothetical protein
LKPDEFLSYYSVPGLLTTVEGFGEQIDAVPSDVASIAKFVQGLLVHEAWAPASQTSGAPRSSFTVRRPCSPEQ